VVFGSSSFGSSLDLSSLNGSNGFVINGIDLGDYSGRSVSNAGDVNGDGIDDLIIGAYGADPNGNYSGESYVVYGVASNQPPIAEYDSATTKQETAVNIDVLANDSDPDSDPLAINSYTNGTYGSVALNDNGTPETTDDYLVYTPNTGYSGSDEFTYTISDGIATDTATVTVEVGANITGTNQDDTLDGTPGDDNISGLQGKDNLNGKAGNDMLLGGNGKDVLIGGTGNDMLGGEGNEENSPDILIGVDPNSANPGVGEIDTITGGGGPDTFVLGDTTNVYYNDGDSNTIGDGDYALITDFTTQDVIELKGSATDYVLDGNYTLGGNTGTAIFLDQTVDELIGFAQGVTGLSLTSNDFSFVS
jgi:hypothetical protein